MNQWLETDRRSIGEILEYATALAKQHFKNNESIPPGRRIESLPMSSLPLKGMGAKETLAYFHEHYARLITNSAGPRYFGFVTGGSTPASVVGDWLVSTFDQNACGSNDSIAPQLENLTIHFLKQLFGIDESYFGSFVTGATMSNFVGLALGRQWIGEQHGIDFSNEGIGNTTIKIFSATAHSSIVKSLSMLGLGRNALHRIDTLPEREAIDFRLLEKALADYNAPSIVVANAGTVNTVDFDDLNAIGRLKEKYNFWLHVDAAFGGFAATSPKYAHLVSGINFADSITIDAHKWLNVPYDAAMQFTRHKDIQLRVFQNSAAYLGDPEKSPDFFHYTPENSRRWRSLPSWFTLMAYGKEGHAEIVERNCDCAKLLGRYLEQSSGFRLLAPVRMNVVCFSLRDSGVTQQQIQEFLAKVRDDGKVFFTPTVYKGQPAIRAAISNWQTGEQDIDITLEALERIYKQSKPSRSTV